jgi:hypothetical protein
MDKLKNNPSWIVLNSPTQNVPKEVKKNDVVYKKQNSTNNLKSIINNNQKNNYAKSTQHISKIEFSIIKINQRSESIANLPIINKLTNLYEKKIILEKKPSSLKLEEINEEINGIENKISETINKLNSLLDKKNEYGIQQSNAKLDDINEKIEMLKNKLSNLLI